MKISMPQLRQIIKEEVSKALTENPVAADPWSVLARWPGAMGSEIIDVPSASNWEEAIAAAEEAMDLDYEPGGEIFRVVDPHGRIAWQKPSARQR